LLRDRRFAAPAASLALASGAMFAYIAGASFVLEDIYGVSAQGFSLVFAANSAGLIGFSQLGGRLVSRVGPATLLRAGLLGLVVGSVGTLIVTVADFGLAPLLISLFVVLCSVGLVYPNATAVALAEQEGTLGSASALLGMGQFGTGAVIAPLVGLGGPHDALPMAILIGVCGTAALAVNLASTRSLPPDAVAMAGLAPGRDTL
jgi:MFS transporter, DHA1 family, multidrug resistance protein